MDDDAEVERWKDNRRRDGVAVRYNGAEGSWVIFTPVTRHGSRGSTMLICPCCYQPFRNVDAAKACAGFLYPLPDAD